MSESRRRDSQQIRYEVLLAAAAGSRKTHIMYEAGLNLKQLNLYLGELTANGALNFEHAQKRYYTTERGRAFIRAFETYRETVSLLNKQEDALTQFFPASMKRPIVAR